MSDETIRPALTSEQWAKARRGDAPWLYRGDDESDDAYAAVVALHNDLLPDGDPRKISRADVEACRAFDFAFHWGATSDSVEVKADDVAALQRVAAKLAALLPPENASG